MLCYIKQFPLSAPKMLFADRNIPAAYTEKRKIFILN